MAISQAICTSFKKELLSGTHNVGVDTFKAALYTSSASLDYSTTTYTTTGEVVSANYTAGGKTFNMLAPTASGTVAYAGPTNGTTLTWNTITVANLAGVLVYNSSKSNAAVSVHAFSSPQNVAAGTIVIKFPNTDGTNGLIKLL